MSEVRSCIGCKHFTVKPRAGLAERDMDEYYRSKGFGRCAIDRDSGRWIRAEVPRQCINLVAIDAAQIAARRSHLARHQA